MIFLAQIVLFREDKKNPSIMYLKKMNKKDLFIS